MEADIIKLNPESWIDTGVPASDKSFGEKMDMRECGMLLPIFSLPSKYGIGAFSKEAYEFVDFLEKAGQRYWQILPLGPTGYGDSPYQSFSAFAGNPLFIDLEQLTEEGLLTEKECQKADFGDDLRSVDYDKVHAGKKSLLKIAYKNWKEKEHLDSLEKVHEKAREQLMEDTVEYCFYMALREKFEEKEWTKWEEKIRLRHPEAMEYYRKELVDEIGFHEFLQLTFTEQWKKLRTYANDKGICIIGDIPIYVSFDSADAWAHPEMFQFEDNGTPKAVAGCPPDAFSETGQLWGNPLYDWGYHEKTGFGWWIRRTDYSFRLYDVVRIDHFRGFDEYYAIPYGEKTAVNGRWEKGPGMKLFQTLKGWFGELSVIAEDLGTLTPSVYELLETSGFPGMKILEFAFDASGSSAYLPHNYKNPNCVVYTGTHDNDTIQGWFEKLEGEDLQFTVEYADIRPGETKSVNWTFIRLALSSIADLAIIPVQDYLGLGSDARINEPATVGTNWKWRMLDKELTGETAEKCRKMARLYGRY